MIKNTAGQKIGAEIITAADGTIFTGAVTVYVTGDAGTQAIGSVGSGVGTAEGNGYFTYAPAQAETNYALVAFTFVGTGAISTTIQVFTQIVQQTADNNTILAHADYGNAKLVRATTPANTLDIESGGTAGIDWGNIANKTTANDLSATDIQLCDTTTTNTDMVDVSDIPITAEFEARTLVSADYVVVSDTIAAVTDVTNQVSADVTAISGSETAADGLEAQFDGVTGLTGDLYPSTQAQVGNIASGTAATNTVASTAVVTSGVETLTYTVTAALDGITHDVAPATAVTDFYYEFNVGGNGVPVGIQWQGYANSVGDEYVFYAYNWVGTSWDQIGIKRGLSGTTIVTQQMDMTTAHVGTGANLGLVRYRIFSTGATTGTNISTDRILCSFSTVYQSVGYANGSIWIDTIAGSAGTIPYVNGTADNPVDTLADGITLAGLLNLRRFHNASGTSVLLVSDSTSLVGTGELWYLALGGQIVTNATAIGATITGDADASSTGALLIDCHFDTVGTGVGYIPSTSIRCGFRDELRLLVAGTYVFKDCYSEVAGTGTPSLDFTAVGASAVNFRNYSGGIEIKNMAAGDTMSLEGNGQLVINTNCSAGTIAIRGNFTITDNVVGGFVVGGGVISDDARYDVDQIDDTITTNAIITDIPNTAEFEARTLVSGSYFDPTADPVANVTLVDTTTTNTDMRGTDGANTTVPDPAGVAPTAAEIKTAIEAAGSHLALIKAVTDALTSAVAAKMAISGGTMVNGAAETGTLSTTEMTTDLTFSVADQYNGRIIIFDIGTTTAALRGQATDITSTTVSGGKLGFTAITTAPVSGDTFIIV